jgi:hypothetical protein
MAAQSTKRASLSVYDLCGVHCPDLPTLKAVDFPAHGETEAA